MHPHNRWALAACWSLNAALTALETRAREAAADAITGSRAARDVGIPSQQFGRRTALGGHGDPTATAYLHGGLPFRTNRAQALSDDLGEQLTQLAHPLPGTGAPLARIRAAIPTMRPDIAPAAARALHRLDEVARRHLRIGPARELLAGQPCPDCGQRRLEVTTVGPEDARVVVCAAAGCRSIWPRAAVIAGAVAGAAHAQPA